MFSLEMYAQLTGTDVTKGYRIAGTGTITPQGEVGVIGGIQHKIVAADREHADIFFAPKDWKGPKGTSIPNYTDAANEAKKIGSKMKVVPVATMDDALQYLAGLTPKAS
jgi:PDZ domain-containing protein